jgi:hypothetical protein
VRCDKEEEFGTWKRRKAEAEAVKDKACVCNSGRQN